MLLITYSDPENIKWIVGVVFHSVLIQRPFFWERWAVRLRKGLNQQESSLNYRLLWKCSASRRQKHQYRKVEMFLFVYACSYIYFFIFIWIWIESLLLDQGFIIIIIISSSSRRSDQYAVAFRRRSGNVRCWFCNMMQVMSCHVLFFSLFFCFVFFHQEANEIYLTMEKPLGKRYHVDSPGLNQFSDLHAVVGAQRVHPPAARGFHQGMLSSQNRTKKLKWQQKTTDFSMKLGYFFLKLDHRSESWGENWSAPFTIDDVCEQGS